MRIACPRVLKMYSFSNNFEWPYYYVSGYLPPYVSDELAIE